jgi:hypothetical protein
MLRINDILDKVQLTFSVEIGMIEKAYIFSASVIRDRSAFRASLPTHPMRCADLPT